MTRILDGEIRTEKILGKIDEIYCGMGGYDDAMIGFTVSLRGEGLGVGDFKGMWAIKWYEQCKWTEESRKQELGEAMMWILGLLRDAKVSRLDQLKGKPVEVTLVDNRLSSWRILTEVI